MSDQDKPTAGEWTAESVKALVGYDIGGSGTIARAHNAALAVACAETQTIVTNTFKKQLAAEREKVQALVDALKEARESVTPWSVEKIDAALAKVGK